MQHSHNKDHNHLDAVIGILGGLIIINWAWGLIKNTSKILLDMENEGLSRHIKGHFEKDDIEVLKINTWSVS